MTDWQSWINFEASNPVMVGVLSSIPIGATLFFAETFLKTMSMWYRNARFVLKMKTSIVTTFIQRMGKVLFSQVCVCPQGGTPWSLVSGYFPGLWSLVLYRGGGYPSPVTGPVQSPVLGPAWEGDWGRGTLVLSLVLPGGHPSPITGPALGW